MNNSVIKLLIYRGFLCGLIGLSNMAFGMIKKCPISVDNVLNLIMHDPDKNIKSSFILDNESRNTSIRINEEIPTLNTNLIDAVLVKEGSGKYHIRTSDTFEGKENKSGIKLLYTDPRYEFPLTDFSDRAFSEVNDYTEKKFSIELYVPAIKKDYHGNAYLVKSIIDNSKNSKKGILFYCGLGVSAFVFIGAILFYLGKLPQF